MVKPQSMAVLIGALLATLTVGAREVAAAQPRFSVVEAGIADMQKAMKDGRVTSRELVLQYLTRIATYEDKLNAAMTVNPRALQEAEALDRERARGKLRGPLHGIPIALKDNIHTTDMPTTGGALAFDGLVPPYEATLVKNLRDAGAIIIAKTVMTELANWVTTAPTLMPAQLQRVERLRHEPVRSAARSARSQFRRPPRAAARRLEFGHRHRGESVGGQRRHRDFRLALESGKPEHAGDHQADRRPHQPLRHPAADRRSGHRGADGTHSR
jgi:hypothetical protein